ncbi:MAG: acyl-CoA dehydrogenase [Pseudomonadales bacterium]|nr:acyl-CoA dehydrogenase [Pseudomonadales bacterium]
MTGLVLLLALLVLLGLIYQGRGFLAWVAASAVILLGWKVSGSAPFLFDVSFIVVVAAIILFGFKPLRCWLVSGWIMKVMRKALPTLGETEEIALKAGSVWWDGELFSGKPRWDKLKDFRITQLTAAEQAFLAGPVEELCTMIDDWQIAQERDLSPELWTFIKENKFLGMIIPVKFGGLGFSAAAHSAVITRISSRSVTVAVTVMVPNSLGPGELLFHYGTAQQQEYYLPRLARGEEVPCFALTEPHAGSDAANGRSHGVVCRGSWEGQDVIGIKLNFNKRYITLAPVATVVGLAFHLRDPEKLLSGKGGEGITCALLPRTTPGLETGNRHDTMGVPFQNGPVRGKDVFIPLHYIIGGQDYAGQGWRMLMEQLSAGRGISLPSLSVGAAQLATRVTTAYANVREQFGLPIGRFEGVRERLARIGGHTYFMNAARKFTAGAVDAGESPSVATAIAKAYMTEGMRLVINDGMDIMAGSAICRGPGNIFSRPYIAIPIGITVEGANILTRSMIIFGQGAIRCHPFVQKEVEAIAQGDTKAFDAAFFGHVNHLARNKLRAFVLAVTGGRAAPAAVTGPELWYYRQVDRLSAAFAYVADVALVTLGGSLKRREYLSARFADTLGWLYLASAVLKQYADEQKPLRDVPLLHWSMTHALYQAEQALLALLNNMPKPIGTLLKIAVFPVGARLRPPSDECIDAVAEALMNNAGGVRDFLTADVFIPAAGDPGLGELEHAYARLLTARPVRNKVLEARRERLVSKAIMETMAKEAADKGLISAEELELILSAEASADHVIQVQDFPPEQFDSLK